MRLNILRLSKFGAALCKKSLMHFDDKKKYFRKADFSENLSQKKNVKNLIRIYFEDEHWTKIVDISSFFNFKLLKIKYWD